LPKRTISLKPCRRKASSAWVSRVQGANQPRKGEEKRDLCLRVEHFCSKRIEENRGGKGRERNDSRRAGLPGNGPGRRSTERA